MKFYLKTDKNDERTIFITGNFNNWNPRDKSYSLQKTKDGYFIEISDDKLPSEVEYKFTKGGWENVEMDSEGHFTSNRKVKTSKKVEDIVEDWRLNWAPFKEQYFPKIELISENFYIPQLNKPEKYVLFFLMTMKLLRKVTLYSICRMHKIYLMREVLMVTGK